MPTKVRIETLEDVDKIPDLMTACKFMMEHKMPIPKNITTIEAKKIIYKFMLQNGPKVNRQNLTKDQNIIQEALEEDRKNRSELIRLYDKAGHYFKDLSPKYISDLERVFPHFQTTLREKAEQLRRSECAIFVAGDTGSGKSTLINLLVGVPILPTHALECTATLCELRKSPVRSIVLHYKEKRPSKRFECADPSKFKDFEHKLQEWVTETDRETEECPYEKIEIYWPFPMMEEGVVLVDTPGIGGSYGVDMDKYMDKALGFIYVINTTEAGGLHGDRLGRLLREAMSNEDFDPVTSVFVCNKWEQVEAKDEKAVRTFIFNKLAAWIPNMSTTQIFKISALQALQGLDNHKMTSDHIKLAEGIRKVLPVSFHSNLLSYYRWLSTILKRTVCSLKISKQMDARSIQEKEKMYQDVCAQIEHLETRAESRLKDMRKDVRDACENISRAAIKTLSSAQMQGELLRWSSDLCPRPDSWKKVVAAASSAISSRIQDVLDRWDRDKGVVVGVKTDIIKRFQRDFDLFQDQAQKIEGVFFADDMKSVVDLHSSMKVRAPVKTVWHRAKKTGARDDGFMSLGSAVGASFILEHGKSSVRSLFKNNYDFGKAPQIMEEATKLFLKELSEKNVVASIEKFFDRFAKNIDRVGKMLPEFLKADRQLMKSLIEDVKKAEGSLVKVYPQLIEESSYLQGDLDMFYAKRLMKFDFTYEELNLSSNDIPIGSGAFANVYFSKISSDSGDMKVALKVCKDPIDSENVTDVMLEDNILRDLDHQNVVKYYGASYQRVGSDMKWIMVLEFCPRTLQQKFVGRQADSPSKHDDIYALKIAAMGTVAQFGEQIACGLEYLHGKNLVHRDMKPDNILLDEDDVVKLTDVGLAKREQEITGTVAGSPVYMAPEVLLQKGRYDVRADMYSMGIILWEMWFGKDAADHIKSQLFTTFERAIEKGLRPSMSLNGKPPDDWRQMIQRCWDMDAAVRPTSTQVRQFFAKFLKSLE